ncbi:hypothetical protein ACF3MZ_26405 [Paenibacillaceae bacterium WGS1546]|uniref:hypothetical protein n=1 Tax=Cohnella sp. WGS1546 TaxID=3366810 RepID=UPI00372D2517
MKKKTLSILLAVGLTALLSNTVFAADTPTLGYKWSSKNITYQNNGSNNAYKAFWTNRAKEMMRL